MPNGALLVAFAAFLWSLDALLRLDLRKNFSAIDIIFWEHFVACFILLPIILWKRLNFRSTPLSSHALALLLGIFASVLATLFYTAALGQMYFSPFSIVVLLQKLQPIWAILTAWIILKENPPRRFILWALCALSAGYLISFPNLRFEISNQDKVFSAAILGLLASFFWGSATTIGKLLLVRHSPLYVTSLRFFWGLLFSLPCLFLLTHFHQPIQDFVGIPLAHAQTRWSISTFDFLRLIWVVTVSGLGAMWLYYIGLSRCKARTATIMELTWPLSALLIEHLWNFETHSIQPQLDRLSLTQWIGIFALVFSMYQVSRLQKET